MPQEAARHCKRETIAIFAERAQHQMPTQQLSISAR